MLYLFNEFLFKTILWLFNFDKKKLNFKKIINIFVKIPNFSNEEILILENLLFFELLGIYFKNKNQYKIAYDYLMKIPNFNNISSNDVNDINNGNVNKDDFSFYLLNLINELDELMRENTLLGYEDTELDLPKIFKNSLKPMFDNNFFLEIDSKRDSTNIEVVNNNN